MGSVVVSPRVIDLVPISAESIMLSGPPIENIEALPEDADGQVEFTLTRMVKLANQDSHTPEIQRDVQQALILGHGNPLERIHSWVRSRMRFVTDKEASDPYQSKLPYEDYYVEAFTRPKVVSQKIALSGQCGGDCDDFSMYCAALLTALNIQCSFCTIAQRQDYSHVYVVAYVDGLRVPMDCSHGAFAGWEENRISRRKEWPVCAGPSRLETWFGIGLGVALLALTQYRRFAS